MTGKSRRCFVLTRKCGESVNCCKTTILGKDQTMWTTILQHLMYIFIKKLRYPLTKLGPSQLTGLSIKIKYFYTDAVAGKNLFPTILF